MDSCVAAGAIPVSPVKHQPDVSMSRSQEGPQAGVHGPCERMALCRVSSSLPVPAEGHGVSGSLRKPGRGPGLGWEWPV